MGNSTSSACESSETDTPSSSCATTATIPSTTETKTTTETSATQHVNNSKDGENEKKQEEGDDEGPKECPLCTYMRAGPCGAQFTEFDINCVKLPQEERDMDKCVPLMREMVACFEKEPDYYEPILRIFHEKDDVNKEKEGLEGQEAMKEGVEGEEAMKEGGSEEKERKKEENKS
eukprot:c2327_g1_i1.p1 GENE.c2327_g1_i1~~c2327_g1_i1.p1  ORF type:complete len:175 (+),score=8.10 c2327_g1_i1:44-568(+)